MKKIITLLMLGTLSLFAADGYALSGKCTACHGASFEKSALGKSGIVRGQSASDIRDTLIAYKEGRLNKYGMGALMQGQLAGMSYGDISVISQYIASISSPDEEPKAVNEDWPYVCEQPDLKEFASNRYFVVVSESDYFPLILADSRSISIDKKNKIIKVWTIWLASEQGRLDTINNLSKYDDYSSFGYNKRLYIINYQTLKTKISAMSDYNCDGSVIYINNTQQGNWDDIIPGSIMEGIVETIVKKYKLK